MEKLYAPWREQFIKKTKSKKTHCIFCEKSQEKNDKKNFIIKRYAHCFVIINLYPYNAGHVMVAPYRHCKDITELTQAERLDIMNAAALATSAIQIACNPEGFNIGFNLGAVAGAGIPGHIHLHIVPRWNGDTNFMPIIADTKHISLDLAVLYKELIKAFTKLD